MDDPYTVLRLPSGEEGAKLSERQICKAHKLKALELHQDKRQDDPCGHTNFQRLKSSYEILKDEKARKLFDDLLKVKREQQHCRRRHSQQCDSKRRKMMSDLEERELAAFAPDPEVKAQEEEERISRKLKEEIARIRAGSVFKRERVGVRKESSRGVGLNLDKERVLKVYWENFGENYTVDRLRDLFSKFGEVEDVLIKTSQKRNSALIVMPSKAAAVAATRSVCGSLSNPLLDVPLQPAVATYFPSNQNKSVEPDQKNNLVGVGYQAHEDAILAKLQKAAKSQTCLA